MRFHTRLIHENVNKSKRHGSTQPVIFQTSAFSYDTAEELEAVFKNRKYGHVYSRINNPTVEDFENRIAKLESGLGALACSSGMSAISEGLMTILKSGDEILSTKGIFGGTQSLFKMFESFDITTAYAKDIDVESFKKQINERTRVLFVETIGNPKMDICNIKLLSEFAHKNKIPLIVDSTVTTPYLVNPIKLGADIVIHSTSKHINGSGNAIGGIIVCGKNIKWDEKLFPMMNEYKKFGSYAYLSRLRQTIHKNIGACVSPMNIYYTSIGLETLGLRMDKMCQNALALAQYFATHDLVESVNYPGLKQHKQHQLAIEQFNGKFGTILTIRVGSKALAFDIINRLKMVYNLANMGDTKTLIIHLSSTIYASCSDDEQLLMGVHQDMLRISLGIEDIEDIIDDFSQALE